MQAGEMPSSSPAGEPSPPDSKPTTDAAGWSLGVESPTESLRLAVQELGAWAIVSPPRTARRNCLFDAVRILLAVCMAADANPISCSSCPVPYSVDVPVYLGKRPADVGIGFRPNQAFISEQGGRV